MSRLPGLFLFTVAFTILHAGLSLFSSLLAYENFRTPNAAEYNLLPKVMLSPLSLLPQSLVNRIPEGLGFALIPINSLVWALCIVLLWSLLRGRRRGREHHGFPISPRTYPTEDPSAQRETGFRSR